jgi:hypothetical protein
MLFLKIWLIVTFLLQGCPTKQSPAGRFPPSPWAASTVSTKKAWFNKQIMLNWIKHVLAPFVAMAPPGIIPILFSDQFRVHKMRLTVNAIQALGAQVEFIPAGCTGLVQPVDIGFNKALKCKMRDEFLKWMMLQDPNIITPGFTCHDVAQWIFDAQNNISVERIHHAWRKTGFFYYPKKP